MPDSNQKIKIWDFPTRFFHWSLIIAIGVSWYSMEQSETELHFWSGYFILGLLAFRIIWGLIGSTTARFSHFMAGPSKVKSYASTLFNKTSKLTEPDSHPGHNPLGGWMVILLILTLLTQTITGLFCSDEFFFDGPLYHLIKSKDTIGLIRDIHEYAFDVLLILASIHISAVLFYWVYKKDNLILPMLTGYKQLSAKNSKIVIKPLWLAISIAVIVAGIIWFIVKE